MARTGPHTGWISTRTTAAWRSVIQDTNIVSIYDVGGRELLADLPIGPSDQEIVAWHPDGQLLAAAGSNPRIQIWDVKRIAKFQSWRDTPEQVTSLNFHPERRIAGLRVVGRRAAIVASVAGAALDAGSLAEHRVSAGTAGGPAFYGRATVKAQLWGIVPSREYHTFLNTFREGESILREGDISPDGTLLALGRLRRSAPVGRGARARGRLAAAWAHDVAGCSGRMAANC